jgi:hypothetical protein
MLLIGNSIVSRAIWKNIHSWVFQRLQIALVLRTRAILIVYEKLTRACFFQIALSKLHCLRYRTTENNRSYSTQNIFIHSQTYTRRRQYSNKINVNIQRNIVGIMESQITSGLANKLAAITNPTLPRTNSPCRKQIALIQRSLHWHV